MSDALDSPKVDASQSSSERLNRAQSLPTESADDTAAGSGGSGRFASFSFSFSNAAKYAKKLANTAAEKIPVMAQKASDTSVEYGKMGLVVTSGAVRAGLSGASNATVAGLSCVSRMDNLAPSTRSKIAHFAARIHVATGDLDKTIDSGANSLADNLEHSWDDPDGLVVGDFFMNISLRALYADGNDNNDLLDSLKDAGVHDSLLDKYSFLASDEFLRLLSEFDLSLKATSYEELRLSLFCIGSLQHILQSPYPPITQTQSSVDIFAPSNIKIRTNLQHAFRYAFSMYGHQYFEAIGFQHCSSSPLELMCRMTDIDPADIVHAEWFCQPAKPAHVIAVDHKHKSVVLSIRGRSTFLDFLWDLKCQMIPFEGSTAHGGLLNSAKWLERHVARPLKDVLLQNDDYRLIVCGHSLGAAIAALLVILFKNDKLYQERKVHAYCFGSPCIVGPELSFISQDVVTSVVLGTDVISRLSGGSISNISDIVRILSNRAKPKYRASSSNIHLEIDEVSLLDMLKSHQTARDLHSKAQWLRNLRDAQGLLRENMINDVLVPAGRTFLILPSNEARLEKDKPRLKTEHKAEDEWSILDESDDLPPLETREQVKELFGLESPKREDAGDLYVGEEAGERRVPEKRTCDTFSGYRLVEMKGCVLDLAEVVLENNLLTDHMPSSYAKALGIKATLKPPKEELQPPREGSQPPKEEPDHHSEEVEDLQSPKTEHVDDLDEFDGELGGVELP